jgi:glycosyltransferase involved in cell wall biosynthesis
MRLSAVPVVDEDAELRLLTPANDVADPELSIVIPALNEELTIGRFVGLVLEGLERANIRGEILIIDSSSDLTADIALSKGARVLKAPKRGLAAPTSMRCRSFRGKYVLMGDADCTYDFRELEPFMERFRGGHEYVMGSRFRGYIEPGSMPPLQSISRNARHHMDS